MCVSSYAIHSFARSLVILISLSPLLQLDDDVEEETPAKDEEENEDVSKDSLIKTSAGKNKGKAKAGTSTSKGSGKAKK